MIQLDPREERFETDSRHRFATYTRLRSGNYTFKVEGSNSSGIWSNKTGEIEVDVVPHRWETWLFRISAVLVLVGLACTSFRLRVHSLSGRRRVLEQHGTDRTAELVERGSRLQESEKAAGGATARKLAETTFTLLIRGETWSAERANAGMFTAQAMSEVSGF